MNAQHQMIRAHKRVKRLVRKMRRLDDKNVFKVRVALRLHELTDKNPQTEYLTLLGV